MQYSLVYMTAGSMDEASRIGKALVEEKLAACVNLISGMKSIYRWKDKIEEDTEVVLIAKTKKSLVGEMTSRVKKMHSYECPCIISFSIQPGNEDFLQWISAETRGA